MQHLNRCLALLAAALCLMAGLSCAGIAAPTHEETLTAWAEQKGWSQFSAYPWLGYRSDEYGSYDISIVHDRPEEWMKRPPYNREERGDYSYYAEIREPITVAGGLAAWREYHKQTLFEAPNSKPGDAKEHENWEYYCHEYLVVVRAQRSTADNSHGSDPIGILEEYIAFARGDVSEPVPTPPEEEAVIRIIEVVGDDCEVDVYGNGQYRDWKEAMTEGTDTDLTRNSVIITGLGTEATLEVGKRGTVKVKEMTHFSIREYVISAEGITAATNMKVGEVNVKVDRKYKEIDFNVSVPTCTVSVRGTEFTVSHREDPVETRISVISGEVEVTPKLFSAPSVKLVEGDEIVVYEDRFGEITGIAEDPSDRWSDEPHEGRDVECTADSHVYAYSYSGWNQANFGRYEILGAGWHPTGGEKRTYLRFDLSGVDPASVGKATLRLYHYHTGGSDTLALGVHRVTSPWTEGEGTYKPTTVAQPGEIAWVHQPSFDVNPVAQFHPGSELGQWVEVDVTGLVASWLSGTPNHGLMIGAVGELNGGVPHSEYGFYAREDEEGRGPVLVLSDASAPDGEFDRACALLCASDEEFIRSLYHCITHREPTVEELEAQVGRLQSGTLRRDMVQYFFASPEYVDQNHDGVRFITDACQAIYGRDPSDGELSAWPRTDRSFIVIEMLDSPEHLAATQGCAALWRRDAASVPTLPYADDLSSGLSHWDVSKVTLQEADGALLWQSGNLLPVSWRHPIPMEDVVIEFDGWCEKNGLNVVWMTEDDAGYMASLGGWFNTRSCTDVGRNTERREYVNGAHIRLGAWQHYKVVRSGDWLDVSVDGQRIIHRRAPERFEGNGVLRFMSYGSVVGIDNLRVYRATAEEGSAVDGVLRAGNRSS